jgi:Niemann-Pick C1 protein
MVSRFIRRTYAPFLLKREVKGAVVVGFAGLFIAAAMGVQNIDLGLGSSKLLHLIAPLLHGSPSLRFQLFSFADQRLALPQDSYLIPYFDALDRYLDVGPPVYFVASHLNVSSRPAQQALCGRFTTGLDLSLGNTLEAERKRPDVSFLANPPAVWLDDFLGWLNPVLETCCRVRRDDPSVFCGANEPERRCRPCFEGKEPPWDITMKGLPEGPEFMRYLRQWMESPTDEECPLGGKSSYGNAISLSSDNSSIVASHFRTYHTPLKTQADFINALASARRVANDLEMRTGAKVYPYSLFYVFFDQVRRAFSAFCS